MIRDISEWFQRVVPERARANPGCIRGVRAVVLFRITGEGGGTWTLRIDDPAVRGEPGEASRPDLTVTLDRQTFLAIANGTLGGSAAYRAGQVRVSGNLLMGLRIAGLLEAAPASAYEDIV